MSEERGERVVRSAGVVELNHGSLIGDEARRFGRAGQDCLDATGQKSQRRRRPEGGAAVPHDVPYRLVRFRVIVDDLVVRRAAVQVVLLAYGKAQRDDDQAEDERQEEAKILDVLEELFLK